MVKNRIFVYQKCEISAHTTNVYHNKKNHSYNSMQARKRDAKNANSNAMKISQICTRNCTRTA